MPRNNSKVNRARKQQEAAVRAVEYAALSDADKEARDARWKEAHS